MAERPIFVVGYQRSGTTLLQSLLGAHPRIAAPPEVHFWFRIVMLADHWGDLTDDARASAVVREVLDLPFGLLDDAGFDEAVLRSAFLETDRSYAALLDTVMSDFAHRHGKQRWSEKTPQQRPAWIWSLLPDAQVIHIVRDPRDVAVSESAWLRRLPAWQSAQRCVTFTSAAMHDGRNAVPGSYLRIGYEDLTREPAVVMASVCEFLGEEFPAAMVTVSRDGSPAVPRTSAPWQREAAAPIRPAVSTWSTDLGGRQRALVAATADELVTTLGYRAAEHRLVVAGRLLRPTVWPSQRLDRAHRARVTRTARTPADRYAAVRSFMADQERRWIT
jgi:hypothetical protein